MEDNIKLFKRRYLFIIVLLILTTLGTWGYFLWEKNTEDQKMTQLQTQYVAVDSSKNELEKRFDAALSRLDSLTGYNNEIEGKISERNAEIGRLKRQISITLKTQRQENNSESNYAGKAASYENKLLSNLDALLTNNHLLNTENFKSASMFFNFESSFSEFYDFHIARAESSAVQKKLADLRLIKELIAQARTILYTSNFLIQKGHVEYIESTISTHDSKIKLACITTVIDSWNAVEACDIIITSSLSKFDERTLQLNFLKLHNLINTLKLTVFKTDFKSLTKDDESINDFLRKTFLVDVINQMTQIARESEELCFFLMNQIKSKVKIGNQR